MHSEKKFETASPYFSNLLPDLSAVQFANSSMLQLAEKIALASAAMSANGEFKKWADTAQKVAIEAQKQMQVLKLELSKSKLLDPTAIALLKQVSDRHKEIILLAHASRESNWIAWQDPSKWFHDLYTTNESGWLVHGFPNGELTKKIVEARNSEKALIALGSLDEIIEFIDQFIRNMDFDIDEIYVDALSEILYCLKNEKWISIQLISILIISSIGENIFLEGRRINRFSLSNLSEEHNVLDNIIEFSFLSALLHFWPADDSNLMILSRNKTMHHLDVRQHNSEHAIKSLFAAMSTLNFVNKNKLSR